MTIYIFNECCQSVYCYNKIYRNTQVNERKQQIPVINTLFYLLVSLSFIVL